MNQTKACCDNINWQFIQDAGHARGCEFTYGKCTNCGTHLIHLFHTVGNDDGYYQVVSPDFVSQMQSLEGNALKHFMKEWYDSL